MTEFIAEIFSKIFNDNVVLATIFVSMVPIMELKGGIPFGMSDAFWGANSLSRWQAFWSAYLGCTIVVIILYFAFVPIMRLLRKTKIFKGLANFIDGRVQKQSVKMQEQEGLAQLNSKDTTELKLLQSQSEQLTVEVQNEVGGEVQGADVTSVQKTDIKNKLYKMLGVFAFVAIPLPLTGIWMGTCIAVMVGLKFWETFISVQLGNLIAGIIISTICVIFPQFTHWLIYIFLILVLIAIIVEIIKHKLNKN